jgi:Ca2+:H+ antiporter
MEVTNSNNQLLKTILIPALAWMAFALHFFVYWPLFNLVLVVALLYCTLQAVHHAEIIALKVGEPFGTMVLALAITSIEVSLIISIMLAGGPDATMLARDTVFAAVMIILNGMIGVSILTGGIKHKEQTFVIQGVSATLTTIVAISVLTLILPNFTKTTPGPYYSKEQLLFVSAMSLILYATFVFVQNIKHKDYFLSEDDPIQEEHPKPSTKAAVLSLIFLLTCLGAVVALAESLATPLEELVHKFGAPHSLVGVIIACVVLMPEGLSAYKAAKNNQLQKSLNLSLGSALASIGLSIPIVAIFSIITGVQLTLGIDTQATVLFLLSLFVIMLSLSTGKTTILQGIILLIIFFVYLFIIIFP